MNNAFPQPWYIAVDVRLAEFATASPMVPLWYERWAQLTPESTEQERLAVYQAIRDSGSLPADAGFWLVALQADSLAAALADQTLGDLEDRMEEIRAEAGLDELDHWPPGEEPAEYEELRHQRNEAWDFLYAAVLDRCGEEAMAQLFRNRRDEFDRRLDAGRAWFFGPEPEDEEPSWLDDLVQAVANCIVSQGASIGSRFIVEDDSWQIWIYPMPVEVIGGANDGEIVTPGFTLELEWLRPAFERIDSTGWNSLGASPADGPFVWIEGIFQGHEVYVEILAQAPADEEANEKIKATR